ncbi:MAG: hypothetical protein ACRD29_13010 [Acidimicrobiales bacterium]
MTDAPQGPGWWQASDGRWYPPEQHPDQPPTQQVPQPGPPPEPTQQVPQTGPPSEPTQQLPPTGPPGAGWRPQPQPQPGYPGGPPPGGPPPGPPPASGAGGSKLPLIIAIAVLVALIFGVGGFLLLSGDGDDDEAGDDEQEETTTTEEDEEETTTTEEDEDETTTTAGEDNGANVDFGPVFSEMVAVFPDWESFGEDGTRPIVDQLCTSVTGGADDPFLGGFLGTLVDGGTVTADNASSFVGSLEIGMNALCPERAPVFVDSARAILEARGITI